MLFIDLNTDETITTTDIFRDYKRLRIEEPENHAESFRAEFLTIVMDTINGRNDVDIIGQTPREIERLLKRIWKTL